MRRVIVILAIMALVASVLVPAIAAAKTSPTTGTHAKVKAATCPMSGKACPTPGAAKGQCPYMSGKAKTGTCPVASKAAVKRTVSAVCPVMGTKIPDVRKAYGKSVYKGKTYYFCCAGCKPKFDKNPAKYAGKNTPKK